MHIAGGMTFGPDDNLYVSSQYSKPLGSNNKKMTCTSTRSNNNDILEDCCRQSHALLP